MTDAENTLTGKLLLAMPSMPDPRFDHSVIYICAHSDEGAMGLIINKPALDVQFQEVLEQLGVPQSDATRQIQVYRGGPVETARGFMLHSADYDETDATLQINDEFAMTATVDVLTHFATGINPTQGLLALGYAGWGAGQLEDELLANGWLTADATPELVFGAQDDAKWNTALDSIGIDPLLLSVDAGHA